MQETFATSDAIRAACGETIRAHAQLLEGDFRAAIDAYPPRTRVTAASLAPYTQTVIQGGFVLSKARGTNVPLLEALAHLKQYLAFLFQKSLKKETNHGKRPR